MIDPKYVQDEYLDTTWRLALFTLGMLIATCVLAWLFVSASSTHADMKELSEKNQLALDCRYNSRLYTYNPSIEKKIINHQGGDFSPYEMSCPHKPEGFDIEHVVARSYADKRGLCHEPPDVKRAFARDMVNLTLASKDENRNRKKAKGPSEYMPTHSRCYYAFVWLRMSALYGFKIDDEDKAVLEPYWRTCTTIQPRVPSCVRGAP